VPRRFTNHLKGLEIMNGIAPELMPSVISYRPSNRRIRPEMTNGNMAGLHYAVTAGPGPSEMNM
jgi:hypothetical protein